MLYVNFFHVDHIFFFIKTFLRLIDQSIYLVPIKKSIYLVGFYQTFKIPPEEGKLWDKAW